MTKQIKRSGLFYLVRKRVSAPMRHKNDRRDKEKENFQMLECECEECSEKDVCEECDNYFCLCECYRSEGKAYLKFLEDNELDQTYWEDKLITVANPKSTFVLDLEFIGDDHYIDEENKEDFIKWMQLTQKLFG